MPKFQAPDEETLDSSIEPTSQMRVRYPKPARAEAVPRRYEPVGGHAQEEARLRAAGTNFTVESGELLRSLTARVASLKPSDKGHARVAAPLFSPGKRCRPCASRRDVLTRSISKQARTTRASMMEH